MATFLPGDTPGRSFATDTSGQRPAPQQTSEAVQNRLTVEVRQAQEYGF
jgi:hypothetical protein